MSGAVQAGQRAALEVLADVYHMDLTMEEQEALQLNETVKSPTNQQPSFKATYFFTRKSVVIAALMTSALLLLAQRQNALIKMKSSFTNTAGLWAGLRTSFWV